MTQVAPQARQGGKTEVQVHVRSLKTNGRTHFKIQEAATLQQVWDEAIDPGHLDEQRVAGDTFRCAGEGDKGEGGDLTDQLGTTLAQLAAEGICPNRHFEIRGPSGGA